MKKDTIDLNFINYSTAALIEFAGQIYKNMKNDTRFSKLESILINMETYRISLLYCSNVSYNQSSELYALTEQRKDDLLEALIIMARYVNRIADGEASVITATGFLVAE
jgi:hypothetical protein